MDELTLSEARDLLQKEREGNYVSPFKLNQALEVAIKVIDDVLHNDTEKYK